MSDKQYILIESGPALKLFKEIMSEFISKRSECLEWVRSIGGETFAGTNSPFDGGVALCGSIVFEGSRAPNGWTRSKRVEQKSGMVACRPKQNTKVGKEVSRKMASWTVSSEKLRRFYEMFGGFRMELVFKQGQHFMASTGVAFVSKNGPALCLQPITSKKGLVEDLPKGCRTIKEWEWLKIADEHKEAN